MSRVRDIANILSASTSISTDAEVASLYAPLINPTFSRIGGDEGGQINFANAATNTTLSGNIALDIYQNRVRLFEGGGNNRGAYLDVSNLSNGVGSELIAAAPQTGNSGKYLTTNGTTASWGTISAGSYTLLSTNAIPSATTTLTVSGIPSGYKHLFINLTGFNPSTSTQTSLRFYTGNGQYTYSSIECSSAGVFNSGYTGAGSIVLTPGDFQFFSSSGGQNNNASIVIYDYTSDKHKVGFWNAIGYANVGDRSAMGQFGINSTAAVTSISFNWSSGAQFLTGTGREVKIFGVN